MSCYDYTADIPPCPICGKEKGAWQGNSKWGHSWSCCGDKCGEALGAKIKDFEDSDEYSALKEVIYAAESDLAAAYRKATGISGRSPFSGLF